MVNFNQPQIEIEFIKSKLSDKADEAMEALFKSTCDNTFTVAKVLVNESGEKTKSLMLASTAVFNSAIRLAFAAIVIESGSTNKISQDTVDECIKLVVERLSKEL